MHSLVRRYIKTAIAFLAAGLAIGGWMIVRRELWGRYPSSYEISAHTHAIFVGFVMMMILGVALWLFPRAEKGDERYTPRRAETAYWILALATGARFLAELARAASTARWLAWIVLAGGVGQALGLGVYFWTMWARIRPVGSHLREAKGERF